MLPKHNKIILKDAEKQGDVIDCSTFSIIWIWLSLDDVFAAIWNQRCKDVKTRRCNRLQFLPNDLNVIKSLQDLKLIEIHMTRV